MKPHLPLIALCLFTAAKACAAEPDRSRPIPPEERLSRIEQQISILLEEVRALRQEMRDGQKPRGPGETVAVEEKMVPGCSVKTYVRTGGADPASPPPSKVTPSDEREDTGKLFDAFAHRAAAGYANEAVTVLWDGFVRITEKDVYEFIFTGYQGQVRIGDQVISQRDTTTRLELTPGYHPVQVLDFVSPFNRSTPPAFSIKRSGADPLPMTPGTLWKTESQ